MWICKECQNQNEENFQFCWSCGNSKSASRKTVRGNTTELSFNKKVESAEKEIPQVKKIEVEVKKPEEKKPVEVEVRTMEEPVVNDDAEVLTHIPPKQTKVKKSPKKISSNIPEPELFSTIAKKGKSSSGSDSKDVNWEKEIFTIAVRLIGLYFILQFILILPEIFNEIYKAFSFASDGDVGVSLYLLVLLLPFAKYLFYLIIGFYLISSGKLLIRLLPEE